jgi:hypothetical protein
MTTQLELPAAAPVPLGADDQHYQAWLAWKQLAGARELLRIGHAICAGLIAADVRAGRNRPVSVKLIWELLRRHHAWIVTRRQRLGLPAKPGFRLNNNFTAYFSRDLVRHRPDWQDRIEQRELGRKPPTERITVIRERVLPAIERRPEPLKQAA